MSDAENGYDYQYYIQRDTGLNADAPIIEYYFAPIIGSKKPNAVFELGSNIESLTRQYDGSILTNRVETTGSSKTPPAVAESEESQNLYGLQDDLISYGDVNSSDVLNALAQIEVALRAQGRITWTMTPVPVSDASGHVPSPFDDYDLGDTIYFTAEKGPVSVIKQGIRVFGLTIDIDDSGIERVSQLQVSPANG